MSGHSKWSTIKRKKGALDAKRGQIFTKAAKMITVAAKQGGGDPDMNFKLRLAIDRAKQVNMPADNIDRAIKKATGEGDTGELYELTYEAYGPSGVALIIEAVTDNKNRTSSEIKYIFSENGGRLGEPGSVSYMFSKKGIIRINSISKNKREDIELTAIDAGAEDIKEENGELTIMSDQKDFENIKKKLEENEIEFDSAEIEMIPSNPLSIDDEEELSKIERLMEALDDQEDVNEIYSNLKS